MYSAKPVRRYPDFKLASINVEEAFLTTEGTMTGMDAFRKLLSIATLSIFEIYVYLIFQKSI